MWHLPDVKYLTYFHISITWYTNLENARDKGRLARQWEQAPKIKSQLKKRKLKFFVSEWRGDSKFYIYKFALRVTDLDQTLTEKFDFLPRSAAEWFHEITTIQKRDMKNLNPSFASALKKGWIYIPFHLGPYFTPCNIPGGNIIIRIIQVSITSRHSASPLFSVSFVSQWKE